MSLIEDENRHSTNSILHIIHQKAWVVLSTHVFNCMHVHANDIRTILIYTVYVQIFKGCKFCE